MAESKELFLYPLTGLFDECHNIDYQSLAGARQPRAEDRYCLRNLNNLWWHEALSRQTLELIVDRLSQRYRHAPIETPQHRAVLAQPEMFFRAVQEAPKTISNLGAGAREAFSALETLQIFCNLYSDCVSFPFALSLQEGLVVNELSSLFLERLVKNHPSVTFNMNILGFDVASQLFAQYEDFGITAVRWPAPAKYFLGNLLDWDCAEVPFEYDRLDQQRNELMRRLLYPWMPSGAMIPTYIFYRLSETSRATLAWKEKRWLSGAWRG